MSFQGSGRIERLSKFNVLKGQSSVSGLSSGAFMTVQLHVAHSSSFVGAGIIAGGPFRCAESFRGSALIAEDAYEQGALYISMNPLTAKLAPNPGSLAKLANDTDDIDSTEHLAKQRIYIFTGRADTVVYSDVVAQTKAFYERLGVASENILYRDDVDAGHSIITDLPEHSALSANCPPYINNGGFMQSHEILGHIYPDLNGKLADQLTGRLMRFDQLEFVDPSERDRSSMSPFGYAYVPSGVLDGAEARVHIVLHGCKQGYNYVNYVNGRPDTANQPPYGNRYITTTGYNDFAEANNIIALYPQVQGTDGKGTQNPDGCWDWWGYTCLPDQQDPDRYDYYSRGAVQIKAIHRMLERLGG